MTEIDVDVDRGETPGSELRRLRLDLVLDRVADGITVQLPSGELVYANDAAARLVGFESAEALVRAPLAEILAGFELLGEDRRPIPLEELPGRRALRGERAEQVVGYRVLRTGEVKWSVVSATPVFTEGGEVDFAINVFRDVTERRKQDERLEFLARAGETLSHTLDYAATLSELARLAVPAVGDWAMVYVQQPDGEIRRLAVEHFAGRHEGMLRQLEDFPFDPDATVGVPAVIRSGVSQLYPEADSRLVAEDVVDGERLAAELEGLGICGWICVPLTARGRTFGAMSFLSTESRRRFGASDLELAEDLARRAALAVDNARLYEEAQRSFAQLDAILASAPVGIGVWDRDLRFVRVNEKLAELNGLPPAEHVGKTLAEVIPDLAPALEPVYRSVVETGEAFLRHEASTELNPMRLGSDRHWLTSYFPVRGPDGEVLGVGAVIMEITDRRRAEVELAARARQQADVAVLGQQALSGAALGELVQEAVERVAATLAIEEGHVLELLPGGSGAAQPAGRELSAGDLDYLRSVSNVLAAASDQAELRELERQARERLRFLGEASRILASSLDYETTLQNVVDLASGSLADWCVVTLLREDGPAHRIVGSIADPEQARRLADELERFPPRVGPDTPLGGVLREERGVLIPVVTDDVIAAAAQNEEHAALLRSLGARSVMIAPILASGRALGLLTFSLSTERGTFTEEDLAHAEELARRAGVAIENARLFHEAERRAQAAQALEFVGDGVFMLDRAGVVRLWNPAAELLTGVHASEVVGLAADEAIPGWAALASRIPIVAAPAGPTARPLTLPVEIRGRELWLSISGVGFEEGTVFAFRDVTEERGVEKLKSDFVSTISHELRTPLAAIYGAALTLRREDAPLDARQRGDLLGVISGESERLARIVNDILWTSRIESGGLQVRIEACDARGLTEGVLQAARTAAAAGHELVLAEEAPVPLVAADPDKVRQVLTNLVDNAVKYSPAGGAVTVRLSQSGGRVRFAVSDEGLGIPLRERERIFEKFYRLDPNLTRGVGGTGLGLYICRELVARMGGRIWVESDEGRGSTFVVELPSAEDVSAHYGRMPSA